MTAEFFRPLDPQPAPDPVTPQASPSDPAGYAGVTPHGVGPAPYDIQAPMADLTGIYNAAVALTGGGEGAPTGAGLVDRVSPRQAEAAALLDSPQGSPAMGITSGWSGGGGDAGWPNNPEPPEDAYNQWTPGNPAGSPTGVPQGTGTD